MGKLAPALLILAIALLLFHFAGLIQGTPTNILFQALLNWDTITEGSLYTMAAAIFAAATVAGAVIGQFWQTRSEIFLIGTLTSTTLLVVVDLVALAITVRETAGVFLSTMLVAPFMLLWVYIVVEWWRGRD